jgi:hypothetical protein
MNKGLSEDLQTAFPNVTPKTYRWRTDNPWS